jgi:hypothetical protein
MSRWARLLVRVLVCALTTAVAAPVLAQPKASEVASTRHKHKQARVGQALRAESRRHARRVAHLAHVRDVAARRKLAHRIAHADDLLAKENTRHERSMAKLTRAQRGTTARR